MAASTLRLGLTLTHDSAAVHIHFHKHLCTQEAVTVRTIVSVLLSIPSFTSRWMM